MARKRKLTLEDLAIKFERLASKELDNFLDELVAKAILMVQGYAKLNVPVNKGELRERIVINVFERDGKIVGRCFTNATHAIYVELGTGPMGEENHDGISPEVNPVYTLTPWFIHESQIDKEIAEKYHFVKIGEFYISYGQPAHPFMYPALADHESELIKFMRIEYAKKVEEELRK